ncbi:hypothetical protein IEO21_05867 [Rhodonia placenta]|uniref:Uncharacterized protein n=1 Tax=Rhodonia placenta TaxID=104341 RepID=A0A8H7P189_9APHY|nr:hypothetical protein IEO21_05867 [Postia placenta]
MCGRNTDSLVAWRDARRSEIEGCVLRGGIAAGHSGDTARRPAKTATDSDARTAQSWARAVTIDGRAERDTESVQQWEMCLGHASCPITHNRRTRRSSVYDGSP